MKESPLNKEKRYQYLLWFIAAVWLVNGLYCKLLNGVPRHEQIVAYLLGSSHSRLLTVSIGIAEIIMAVWVISRYKSKFNAIVQMALVAMMNVLEFVLVPEFLLWGKYNLLFALLFICLIFYTEFILGKQIRKSH